MNEKKIVFRQQGVSASTKNLMEMETEHGILHNITDVSTVITEGKPTAITIRFLVDVSTSITGDWVVEKTTRNLLK